MITERTLRKWRKEALLDTEELHITEESTPISLLQAEKNSRILRMTQELLDQHLLRKDR